MSNRVTALVGGMLLVVAFLAGTTQGCGSSSGGDNPVDLCNRGCDKYVMCNPEAQAFTAQCKSLCSSMAPGSGGTCTNQTEVVNAIKACLNASCADLDACQAAVPECEGGTGAGGSTGAAGTTGAAGSTGAAGTTGAAGSTGAAGTTGAGGAGAGNCSVCDKAASCCLAIGQPAATCNSFSAATCNMLTGANQTAVIQGCQGVITAATSSGSPPAACQ